MKNNTLITKIHRDTQQLIFDILEDGGQISHFDVQNLLISILNWYKNYAYDFSTQYSEDSSKENWETLIKVIQSLIQITKGFSKDLETVFSFHKKKQTIKIPIEK